MPRIFFLRIREFLENNGMNAKPNNLDALLDEKRQFRASAEFRKKAVVGDRGIYDKAKDDRLNFWESWAGTLKWNEKWQKNSYTPSQ